jgi:cell wall-associated NlpC family hydrolase
MTTVRTTPARRASFFRRAVVAVGLAFGITLTALPAQPALAWSLTYNMGGVMVTAPNWPAREAVSWAWAQRGDPYVWGGGGPSSFDCSGLTQYAWGKAGVSLPHSSRMQSTMGRWVSKSALKPGDLVFFYSPVSHVAMYIGNGYIIHASTPGSVVHTTKLAYMSSYVGARRPVG